jgi:hypothetical protein
MDILWRQFKDERRHARKDVLAQLKLKPGVDIDKRRRNRLRRFTQHGKYPRDHSLYSWVTNDDHNRWLSIAKKKLSD